MDNIKVRAYAKVNFYLDVFEKANGYHSLDSFVCSVDLYDQISIIKRNDNKINLHMRGEKLNIPTEDNNAFKAAKLFQERFNVGGVDIYIKKNIPIGGGLGGSSADISATLNGLKQLFEITDDVKPLADSLGSDTGYMLTGGYARLTGRGEIVESLDNIDTKLNLLLVIPPFQINTAECYAKFDELLLKPQNACQNIIDNFSCGKINKQDFFNGLYQPANELNSEISAVNGLIGSLSPNGYGMTGSGSGFFAIFDSYELCQWAKSKIKPYKYKCIITTTLTKQEINSPKGLKNPFSLY